MGPTLWDGNLNIYDGGHASHLDMLHNSPNGAGIAWGPAMSTGFTMVTIRPLPAMISRKTTDVAAAITPTASLSAMPMD